MGADREQTRQFSVRLPLAVMENLDRLAAAGYRNRTQEIIRLIEEETRRVENKPKETP